MNIKLFLGLLFFMFLVGCKNNKKKELTIVQSSENIDYSSPEYFKNDSTELKKKTKVDDAEIPDPQSIIDLFNKDPFENNTDTQQQQPRPNAPIAPNWNNFGNVDPNKKEEDGEKIIVSRSKSSNTTKQSNQPLTKPTLADLDNRSKQRGAMLQQQAKNVGKQFESASRNPYMAFKAYEFDQYATNYKRFKNSPCYNKLGFDPIRALKDSIGLEREYQVCEKEHRIKRNTKIFIYFLAAFMLFTVTVVLFKKYYKKQIN